MSNFDFEDSKDIKEKEILSLCELCSYCKEGKSFDGYVMFKCDKYDLYIPPVQTCKDYVFNQPSK